MIRRELWIVLLYITFGHGEISDCDYFDTVDLTASKKFPNGSYLYEHVLIPAELTGEYDYEILADGETSSVPNHVRGCACRLRSCVRFCCHRNLRLVDGERKCSGDIKAATDFDPFINVTQADGQMVRKHVLDEFVVQDSLPVPCSDHFYLDAANVEDHGWTLFENGTLLRHFDNQMLFKHEYCLQPHAIESPDKEMQVMLVPHNCMDEQKGLWSKSILMILTIIGLILTIVVYLSLSKLRDLHGKCFICYMLCLTMAYIFLIADLWKTNWPHNNCMIIGYAGYYSVTSGFLWLTVICFDLWLTFYRKNNNAQRTTQISRFRKYSLYAWGVAALLTVIVITMDKVLDAENEEQLVPGVAIYSCWVKTHDWSAMIYLYGPMSLQLIFNITMFILTARLIIKTTKKNHEVQAGQDQQRHLNSYKQNYSLFVRLFVIMGITWTLEIFGYLTQDIGVLSTVFLCFDYINYAQGIIIFIIFVLKPSVIKLITERIRGIESTDDGENCEEEIALQERNTGARNIGPRILN